MTTIMLLNPYWKASLSVSLLELEYSEHTLRVSSSTTLSYVWTLTKHTWWKINRFFFHWRLLRKVIHVTWPRVITNEELYKCTKVTPWSLMICKRRLLLLWFGQLLQLPSETPAKRSLKAFVKTWKRSAGRSKTTWLSQILSDISKYSNVNLSEVQEKDLENLEKKFVMTERR